ncbi:MAG: 1-deoxy-D-xylulose-5-phosphate reductoisomerase [Chloroflexi bacterium]|nr:1-deoxy-D-xylulose-5-phosphate reductoisomerase [Chloroflexota bacterium]MXY00428.1 1-deoxy-D-xylulose-5-phosphate reductoisomerase [Chloroflexota bacterium]MYC47785.1 1-deoxy-D-xylulose-5-phosphate reductoisomerase [Chloroflexota bacterium]
MGRPTRLAILGSTGSIGTQALGVVEACPGEFDVVGLAAGRNLDLLLEQARRFGVERVALAANERSENIAGVTVLGGDSGLIEIAAGSGADLVLVATVGAGGFAPTVAAVEAGIDIALASKELLVMSGQLLMRHAEAHGVSVRPVDSEHSAVWQCLWGEDPASIDRIILTASGGPFREVPLGEFARVTPSRALAHPTWEMGPKVSIDSATLMNKGLEVIEASWLFGMPADRVDVLIHPQSIVHSLVEFIDGSQKAQLGVPDMRIPISCALGMDGRLPIAGHAPRLDLAGSADLEFEEPDLDRFPLLDLARRVALEGGCAPALLVGADDAAVEAFLEERIRFDQLPQVVAAVLADAPRGDMDQISDALDFHQQGYRLARDQVRRLNR